MEKIIGVILGLLLIITIILPAQGRINDDNHELNKRNLVLEYSISTYHIECNFSGLTLGFPFKINLGFVNFVPFVWAKSDDNSSGKVGHFSARYLDKTILDMDANEFLYVRGFFFNGNYDLSFLNKNGGSIKGEINFLFEIYADGELYRFNFPSA